MSDDFRGAETSETSGSDVTKAKFAVQHFFPNIVHLGLKILAYLAIFGVYLWLGIYCRPGLPGDVGHGSRNVI